MKHMGTQYLDKIRVLSARKKSEPLVRQSTQSEVAGISDQTTPEADANSLILFPGFFPA